MKKRFMSVLLGAVMTATLLTGCGGQETNSSLPSDEKESEVSAPASAEGDMVSDEDFATLQGNYNILTELYNAVATRYNSGDIQKDAELEAALNQAHDIIEQLGDVKQEDLTQDKAVELNNGMFELIDALVAVADVG